MQKSKPKSHAKRTRKVAQPKVHTPKTARMHVRKTGIVDTRMAKSEVGSSILKVVSATDRVVEIQAQLNYKAIETFGRAYIEAALKKGWAASLKANQLSYPYQAYVFFINVVLKACQGLTLGISRAPKWLWGFLSAIKPKSVPYKTGTVSYSWVMEEGTPYIPACTTSFPFTTMGVRTANQVNGFNTLTDISYSEGQGEQAIQALFAVFADGPMNTVVEAPPTDPFANDTSCFSASYTEFGYSEETNAGGFLTTLYNEKKITCPLLAKFAYYYDGPVTRAFCETDVSSGTASYIIPRILEFESADEFRNKVRPIFKYFYFEEFFEVLSLIMAGALENNQRDFNSRPVPPCPLTAQQVRILLRQNLVPIFNNEFAADLVFGYGYVTPMFPFSVGANGSAVHNAHMLLPTFFVENIRACARKKIRLSAKFKKEVLDYVPVLAGSLMPITPNYTYDGTSGSTLLYAVSESETPIDIQEASVIIDGIKVPLDLNSGELDSLASIWNDWISQLGSYLSSLATIGSEKGINALSTVSYTLHSKTIEAGADVGGPLPKVASTLGAQASAKSLGRQNSKGKFALGLSTQKEVGTVAPAVGPGGLDVFQIISPQVVTSNCPVYDGMWKYLSVMILPIKLAQAGGALNNADISSNQVLFIEPYSIALESTGPSEAVGVSTMYRRHLAMAKLDLRTPLSPKKEVEVDLETLLVHGRGGLFASLAGMFAEDVLGLKGGRDVANTVGGWVGL